MNKIKKAKLEKAHSNYFKKIHKIYTDGNFREESFYPALKLLIEECSLLFSMNAGANALVLPKQTEVGIPDFRIGKNGEIFGYIEAKSPETNLKDIEDSEQVNRYRSSFPNFILTNFLEFKLYRNFYLINKVEVGRQFTLQSLKYAPVSENLNLFYNFLEEFFSYLTPEIKNSSHLSVELTKRTRFLEHVLQEEFTYKSKVVTRFFRAFQ